MKKVRFFLAAIALVFAIGGAFASKLLTSNTVAYEFIPTEQCKQHTATCNPQGQNACVVGTSAQLREEDILQNSCGAVMYFPTN